MRLFLEAVIQHEGNRSKRSNFVKIKGKVSNLYLCKKKKSVQKNDFRRFLFRVFTRFYVNCLVFVELVTIIVIVFQ